MSFPAASKRRNKTARTLRTRPVQSRAFELVRRAPAAWGSGPQGEGEDFAPSAGRDSGDDNSWFVIVDMMLISVSFDVRVCSWAC